MDKRLQFTPEQYKGKLSIYAQDTIDFQSPIRWIKYKVNKNDNPTVVEIVNDYFKIYMSSKPTGSLIVIKPRQSDYRKMFLAKVFISEGDVDIKVFMHNIDKIWYLIISIFSMGLVIRMFANNNFDALFFILFFLTSIIFLVISKRRYKRFVINFMNNL